MKDRVGRMLLNWRIRQVLPHIEGKFLDIGCGTNEIVSSYQGDGTGVDVYPWGNVDVIVKDTANLPFEDKKFDTASIVAALGHIPNRERVMEEVNRVLKDDGKFIVTVIPPRFSKIWHYFRKPWDADQKERGMKEGEVYGFTLKETEKMLNGAGFVIVFKKKFMFGINNLIISKKRNY